MNYIQNINKYLYILVFTVITTAFSYAQSVNAGGSATTCGTTHTLSGSTEDGGTKGLTWSVVGKPTGATDPVISNPSILNPSVTGMNKPGVYTFRLTKVNPTSTVYSEVKITSTGDVASFSAGSDITNIPASIGTVNLNGVIPEGFKGEWRAENNFEKIRFARINSNNATLSATNIANPTFSLTKKANHDTDPAYTLYFRITSMYNSNCWYEKSITVRFIPNPEINLKGYNACATTLQNNNVYVQYQDNSPKIGSFYNGTTGYPGLGTTITLNIIEQPAGGNLSLSAFETGSVHFVTNAVGLYRYTITISNSIKSYTTPELTIDIIGLEPGAINFKDSAYPEQYMLYAGGGSGGEVLCNMVGSLTPININYSLNTNDDPTTINTNVSVRSQDVPGGLVPTIESFGNGLTKRYFQVTPPVGGWKIGTYPVSISINRNGTCSKSVTYYIHVSDGKRPNLKVDDVVVCYPGSGVVDALVSLPSPFQEVIDPTYMKGYTGKYEISLVSKPEGSATPSYDPYNTTRSLKSTQTVIHNLNMPGEYVFKVKTEGYIESVDWLLAEDYACSGTSRETTFKVTVSAQVGSNAGSNQEDLFCRARTVLVGNNPGAGQGKWTVESAPIGMVLTFSDDTSPRTIVAGMEVTGSYKFKWTITTGDCESSSIVEVITDQDNCKAPKIITNPTTTNKTIRRKK
ncbi:hypothetical protein HMPREF9713_00633 [Myroides odoratimimus CCUG 12700]|uniref:hypothetical protein n=1 Tax=Myroides odoratimimus TaxID=76832 RepID=UPI000352BB62|nr:hypothetical protein [Myroides odoratimimus]EPH13453.1 hypothetical protein HMPREF9713_00633 [Myroides odoratimimus CCUG 12700]